MPSQQLVEKIGFAHEVGFLNPFFAPGFPGQKTLLSQQVCGVAAKPPKRARSWDVRRKSPFRGFFDGLRGCNLMQPLLLFRSACYAE